MKVVSEILRYLCAPRYCLSCYALLPEETVLCRDCLALMEPVFAQRVCIGAAEFFVHAVAAYQEPFRSLLLAKLSSGYTTAQSLGTLLWHHSNFKELPCDYIVPVPLHYTRYAMRGYNQVEVMCDRLSKLSGKPVVNVLKRIRRTKTQAHIPLHQRFENVKDCFVVMDAEKIKGKALVLIDDLMTTGATLYNAGKVLSEADPSSLHALVVCRTR